MSQPHCSHCGHYIGDITLAQNFQIHGLVSGTVTIAAGKQLHLNGRIEGDLIVQEGARVLIHGAVSGTVLNRGADIKITGIAGSIQDVGNRKTLINDQTGFEKSGADMAASFQIEIAAMNARRGRRRAGVATEQDADVMNICVRAQKKAVWTSWITAD